MSYQGHFLQKIFAKGKMLAYNQCCDYVTFSKKSNLCKMGTIIIVPSGIELMNVACLEQGPPCPCKGWQYGEEVCPQSPCCYHKAGRGEEVLGSLGWEITWGSWKKLIWFFFSKRGVRLRKSREEGYERRGNRWINTVMTWFYSLVGNCHTSGSTGRHISYRTEFS